MKLLFCLACHDVVKLQVATWRPCQCGRSNGRYLEDGLHGEVVGDTARVIGVDNRSVRKALHHKAAPTDGAFGAFPRIDAFLFPTNYYRVRHIAVPGRKLTALDLGDTWLDEPFPLPESF